MAEPKNKYDYLAPIVLSLAFMFMIGPAIALVIRSYQSTVLISEVALIFTPAILVLPLSLLAIKFAEKANQTPLALSIKAESENRSESK